MNKEWTTRVLDHLAMGIVHFSRGVLALTTLGIAGYALSTFCGWWVAGLVMFGLVALSWAIVRLPEAQRRKYIRDCDRQFRRPR